MEETSPSQPAQPTPPPIPTQGTQELPSQPTPVKPIPPPLPLSPVQPSPPLNPLPPQTYVAQSQAPSHPEIELKPGGAWHRFWAHIIDYGFVIGILTSLIVILLSAFLGYPASLGKNIEENILYFPIFVLFTFSYFTFLIGKYGTTLGKDAYGLKVVCYQTNGPVSYGRAFLREVIKLGAMIIFPIHIISGFMIIFSSQKRGIHDLTAQTQVLKVKEAWGMPKQIGCAAIVILIFLILVVLLVLFSKEGLQTQTTYP